MDIEHHPSYPEATDQMYINDMHTKMLYMHHDMFIMKGEIQSLSMKLEALSAHVNGDHAADHNGVKRRFGGQH
jgi:hypothetical protein